MIFDKVMIVHGGKADEVRLIWVNWKCYFDDFRVFNLGWYTCNWNTESKKWEDFSEKGFQLERKPSVRYCHLVIIHTCSLYIFGGIVEWYLMMCRSKPPFWKHEWFLSTWFADRSKHMKVRITMISLDHLQLWPFKDQTCTWDNQGNTIELKIEWCDRKEEIFDRVPLDVMRYLLSFLEPIDLGKLSIVNRDLYFLW